MCFKLKSVLNFLLDPFSDYAFKTKFKKFVLLYWRVINIWRIINLLLTLYTHYYNNRDLCCPIFLTNIFPQSFSGHQMRQLGLFFCIMWHEWNLYHFWESKITNFQSYMWRHLASTECESLHWVRTTHTKALRSIALDTEQF